MLENTYKALEAEGKSFKGRMRERIAQTLKVSPAQIGKIENISHNAIEEVKSAVSAGSMSISTANEVARLPNEKQKKLVKSKPIEKISHKEVKAQQKHDREEHEYETEAKSSEAEEDDVSEKITENYDDFDTEPTLKIYSIDLTLSEKEILKKAIRTITASGTDDIELINILKKLEKQRRKHNELQISCC